MSQWIPDGESAAVAEGVLRELCSAAAKVEVRWYEEVRFIDPRETSSSSGVPLAAPYSSTTVCADRPRGIRPGSRWLRASTDRLMGRCALS